MKKLFRKPLVTEFVKVGHPLFIFFWEGGGEMIGYPDYCLDNVKRNSLLLKVRQIKELESSSSPNCTAYIDHMIHWNKKRKSNSFVVFSICLVNAVYFKEDLLSFFTFSIFFSAGVGNLWHGEG